MATFTVEITPDSSNGTIAHAVGKFSGGSSSYKGQRRMDVSVSGVGTFSALSPETSGGENTFSLYITGLTPGTTYNWSASLYYKNTSGGWVTAGSQYDKSGSFTTANSGTTSTVPLSAKAVGSIVKLKVNGAAKEFIVVHQGKPSSLYDDSCNGTWLLMKDIYENRVWQSGNINKYESSDIHLPPDMEVDSSGNVTPPPPATHKTLINGTVYTVQGGKCMVDGTVYNILKGRTLIGGTGYDITFPSAESDVSKTWYFNNTIDVSIRRNFAINFLSGGLSCQQLQVGDFAGYLVYYSGGTAYRAYSSKTNSWYNGTNYRTITFDEAPSGDLLTWLQANATPQ